jgi:hypothetical protein
MAEVRETRTLTVDLRRLERTGPDGVLALRVMRAANDLAAANAGWRHANREFPCLEKHMQDGVRRYYVRIQCGHLVEAVDLVPAVCASPRLRDLVDRCSASARASFGRLLDCTEGRPRRKDFEQYIIRLRHQVAFHYGARATELALKRRAASEEMRFSRVTLGSNIDLWRFNVADDIELSVVARILWKIPDEADAAAEDDRISGFASGLCLDFINFAGELCERFLIDHALAR